jgi:hypothetical protein
MTSSGIASRGKDLRRLSNNAKTRSQHRIGDKVKRIETRKNKEGLLGQGSASESSSSSSSSEKESSEGSDTSSSEEDVSDNDSISGNEDSDIGSNSGSVCDWLCEEFIATIPGNDMILELKKCQHPGGTYKLLMLSLEVEEHLWFIVDRI